MTMVDVQIGLGSEQRITERRLNAVEVIRQSLTPEQRNEEQRQREAARRSVPPYRITLAELQERVRRHYARFGIRDVRVQWHGAGIEVCFGAGLSTHYDSAESAIAQVEIRRVGQPTRNGRPGKIPGRFLLYCARKYLICLVHRRIPNRRQVAARSLQDSG